MSGRNRGKECICRYCTLVRGEKLLGRSALDCHDRRLQSWDTRVFGGMTSLAFGQWRGRGRDEIARWTKRT